MKPQSGGEAEFNAMLSRLVEMANEAGESLTGHFSEVKAIVDAGEVVYGIWQDYKQPQGVGYLLIKGHQLLREVSVAGATQAVPITAVPCISAEQAEALRMVAGEKDLRH